MEGPDRPITASLGGRRLMGRDRGAGGPTVVLEMGLGATGSFYDDIAEQVAAFARVVTYDRAGLGQSDPAPKPRTIQDIASDLHLLLHQADIPGPFVLVGHAMGGLTVRFYREHYPEEVAALGLIDAAHEAQQQRLSALLPPERADELPDLALLRHAWIVDWFDPLANGEGVDNAANSELMRSCGTLGATPLTVISRGRSDRDAAKYPAGLVDHIEHAWRDMQDELAQLSSDSQHIIARKSGHVVNRDEPELVIACIRQMVMRARAEL